MIQRRQIRTLIVEGDPFCRDLIEIVLRRDWRTQVVDVAGNPLDLPRLLEEHQSIDLILLDSDWGQDTQAFNRTISFLEGLPERPTLLFTSRLPVQETADCLKLFKGGYVIKSEILYSIAWAAAVSTQKQVTVISPGVRALLPKNQNGILVMKTRAEFDRLTPTQTQNARLGIIFNLPHPTIAEELDRSLNTIHDNLSLAYGRLYIDSIQDGGCLVEDFFEDQKKVFSLFEADLRYIWERGLKQERKAGEKDTLAFHLLTLPEMVA